MNFLKRILFFCVMILFLAAAAGILGEIMVRIFVGDEIPLFPRIVNSERCGDFSIRTNTPGVKYIHKSSDGRWEVRINSQGFRADRDFTEQKPAGVKRILLLGDSFTMASEVNIEDSFGAVLERELRQKGYETEVINTGVSGFSNAEELVVLENKGLKFQPDVVIQSFFINDYVDNLRAGLYALQNGRLVVRNRVYAPGGKIQTLLRRLPVYLWVAQHSYLYNYLNRVFSMAVKGKLEKENQESILKESGEVDMESYQAELAYLLVKQAADVSRRHEAAFILMDIPTFWSERSVKFADRIKSETDFFLDSLALFEPMTDVNAIYRPHGDRHWTEPAHQKVGKALAEKIVEIFEKEKKGASVISR